MYGADWCSDGTRAKSVLESHDVAFEYINLVESPEKAGAAQAISGRTSIPVITFPDGSYFALGFWDQPSLLSELR